METNPKQALLVVDVQNDFCPGGTLAVEHGDEVVHVSINGNLMNPLSIVILTPNPSLR